MEDDRLRENQCENNWYEPAGCRSALTMLGFCPSFAGAKSPMANDCGIFRKLSPMNNRVVAHQPNRPKMAVKPCQIRQELAKHSGANENAEYCCEKAANYVQYLPIGDAQDDGMLRQHHLNDICNNQLRNSAVLKHTHENSFPSHSTVRKGVAQKYSSRNYSTVENDMVRRNTSQLPCYVQAVNVRQPRFSYSRTYTFQNNSPRQMDNYLQNGMPAGGKICSSRDSLLVLTFTILMIYS